MVELADKKCLSCAGQSQVLSQAQAASLLKQLNGWTVEKGKCLSKTYALKDFTEALALANIIGALAEEEAHHPDLLVRWGSLCVTLWTHSADALTENDFILAAKIDRLKPQKAKSPRSQRM
jgi:4a-hydroxytetrahydrobiopterin dehydratase